MNPHKNHVTDRQGPGSSFYAERWSSPLPVYRATAGPYVPPTHDGVMYVGGSLAGYDPGRGWVKWIAALKRTPMRLSEVITEGKRRKKTTKRVVYIEVLP